MSLDLLFDLDGTLTDPEPGIVACFYYALAKLGCEKLPQRSALRRYIGPPLRQSFAEILETNDERLIESAVAAYREGFAEVAIYENEVYPDVPAGLTRLKDDGHRLWVVTLKAQVFARRIIEHFNLAGFFQQVYGPELDGRNSEKSDLIAHVIERETHTVAGLHDRRRAHDMAGGRANGTRTIGVLWGYGTEGEIKNARPNIVVDSIPPARRDRCSASRHSRDRTLDGCLWRMKPCKSLERRSLR
jgi:phosphoglycolate phosphatase